VSARIFFAVDQEGRISPKFEKFVPSVSHLSLRRGSMLSLQSARKTKKASLTNSCAVVRCLTVPSTSSAFVAYNGCGPARLLSDSAADAIGKG
jgi:hypothetical protein